MKVDAIQEYAGTIQVEIDGVRYDLSPNQVAEINRLVDLQNKRAEDAERAELARLLAKYPQPPAPVLPKDPLKPLIWPPRVGFDKCGKCGIELHPVMGYVCPHSDCPSGLGGTISMGGFGT